MPANNISRNMGAGVLFRQGGFPINVRNCVIRECRVSGNAKETKDAQIAIYGDANDIIIERNWIEADCYEIPAILAATGAERIFLEGNNVSGSGVLGVGDAFTSERPDFACGHAPPSAMRIFATFR